MQRDHSIQRICRHCVPKRLKDIRLLAAFWGVLVVGEICAALLAFIAVYVFAHPVTLETLSLANRIVWAFELYGFFALHVVYTSRHHTEVPWIPRATALFVPCYLLACAVTFLAKSHLTPLSAFAHQFLQALYSMGYLLHSQL